MLRVEADLALLEVAEARPDTAALAALMVATAVATAVATIRAARAAVSGLASATSRRARSASTLSISQVRRYVL